jgi:translation initiation factor 3 subunit K
VTEARLQVRITMPAFDAAPDRPNDIHEILIGLDRYNPETTTVFQDYVVRQCEDRTYDCYANLALLKLCVPYVFIYRSRLSTTTLMITVTTFPIT